MSRPQFSKPARDGRGAQGSRRKARTARQASLAQWATLPGGPLPGGEQAAGREPATLITRQQPAPPQASVAHTEPLARNGPESSLSHRQTQARTSGSDTKDTHDHHPAQINQHRSEGTPAGPAASRPHFANFPLILSCPGHGVLGRARPRHFSVSVYKGRDERRETGGCGPGPCHRGPHWRACGGGHRSPVGDALGRL